MKFSKEILATTTVSTAGGAVTADFTGIPQDASSAYLTVLTSNEAATASLAVVVSGLNALGAWDICTASAITTETLTTILVGSAATAGEGIADACDFPLPRSIRVTFTVTGAAAAFDVRAYLEGVSGI